MRSHVFHPLSPNIMPRSLGGGISARCSAAAPFHFFPLLSSRLHVLFVLFSLKQQRQQHRTLSWPMSTRCGRRKLRSVGIRNALLRSDKQTTEKRPKLTDQCEDVL